MRRMRRALASALFATAAFAVFSGGCQRKLPKYEIQEAVIRVSEMFGCRYNKFSGQRLIGPDGPVGTGPGLEWFNLAWMYLPIVIPYLIGFVVALPLYHFFACPWFVADGHGHSRFVGDGHTRCGRCGHILKGLSQPRCPECGLKI